MTVADAVAGSTTRMHCLKTTILDRNNCSQDDGHRDAEHRIVGNGIDLATQYRCSLPLALGLIRQVANANP